MFLTEKKDFLSLKDLNISALERSLVIGREIWLLVLEMDKMVLILFSNLALKGGTAINLTIFDLPRLSVDIDLDFTNHVTKDEMLIIRQKITNLLKNYLKK